MIKPNSWCKEVKIHSWCARPWARENLSLPAIFEKLALGMGASAPPACLPPPFCSLGKRPQISPVYPAPLSFHRMTFPASKKTPSSLVRDPSLQGEHSASPGEEQIYFFSCDETLWAAYCFNAVHNYRNCSANLYILSVLYYTQNIPQFFFVYMNQLKIYFGILYVILKLNSQFLL